MNEAQRPALTRYGFAVLVVFLSVFLLSIPVIGPGLTALLFLSVMVSAWYGGLGPGLLATGLIVASGLAFFVKTHTPMEPSRVLSMVLFTGVGILITTLIEALHAARRRAEWGTAEAKRQGEVLQRSQEALKQADRRKDEFLAMLAHELRNPLAAISSAVQFLQLKGGPDDFEWGTQVIERQTADLARLIDDLMDVSRVSQGKVYLRKELIDVRPVVRQAVEDVRPAAEARKHQVLVSLPTEPLWLLADATRMRQIVVNLLTNAVKYSEPWGRIEVSAARLSDEVVLRVRDTGVGIAPEMLPRVFEMYAQADRTLDRSQGGLGIGLTLVRQLTELHEGSVSASSEGIGRGSEFTVRVPAAEGPVPAAPVRPSSPAALDARPLRVLVVDDNVDTAASLSRLLEARGHEVFVAHDGPSAIDEANTHGPDAVLLDIGLPGIDGYQVAEQLRREEDQRGMTLIAISGFGQQQDLRRSREAGIDHHLVKPFELSDVLPLLDRLRTGDEPRAHFTYALPLRRARETTELLL